MTYKLSAQSLAKCPEAKPQTLAEKLDNTQTSERRLRKMKARLHDLKMITTQKVLFAKNNSLF